MKNFYIFIKELYHFARYKIFVSFLLSLLLGCLDGVGILLLLPLLSLVGIGQGADDEKIKEVVEYLITFTGSQPTLFIVLLIYTATIGVQSGLKRYHSVLNTTIQETFDSYLNNQFYQAVTYAKWSFFLTVKKTDIAHTIAVQLARVSAGIFYFLRLVEIVLFAGIEISLALLLAPYLTILVLLSGLLLAYCLHPFVWKARKMGEQITEASNELFSGVDEHLNGIKEIKSYGLEPLKIEEFARHRKQVENTFIAFSKLQSKTDFLYKTGAAICISAFCYAAIELFHTNTQNFLVLLVIFSRLWPKFSSFQAGVQWVIMMASAFQSVVDVRAKCIKASEQEGIHIVNQKMRLERGVRLNDVSFHYAENSHYAVKDVNLFLPKGKTTVVIGTSGAGKSTLADLIIGLITPQKGAVFIDGTLLDRKSGYMWRKSIGYISQDAFLFHASIRENLKWACPNATEQEIWETLELAGADQFVKRLPLQLDAVVGDRGLRLSGGERQRIVLARAILRKPDLLVMDEPTNSLDMPNVQNIQQVIDELRGKMTILLITHRPEMLCRVDQVVTMEQGEIIGKVGVG